MLCRCLVLDLLLAKDLLQILHRGKSTSITTPYLVFAGDSLNFLLLLLDIFSMHLKVVNNQQELNCVNLL